MKALAVLLVAAAPMASDVPERGFPIQVDCGEAVCVLRKETFELMVKLNNANVEELRKHQARVRELEAGKCGERGT